MHSSHRPNTLVLTLTPDHGHLHTVDTLNTSRHFTSLHFFLFHPHPATQHLQFYKMAAFEGSTRVPIVMAGPGVNHVGDGDVNTLVTLADLMPTMLDYAGVQMPQRFEDAPEDPEAIDGYSLKNI